MKLSQLLWPHRYQQNYLEVEELRHLREAVLGSPYLADTDLNEGFAGTYGFSLLFHREELDRVEKLIPELAPHFKRVLHPKSNVLFLNPLVIQVGRGVEPHADKTLVSFVKGDPPFPFAVSVLYLGVPAEKSGGELVFHRWFGKHVITPEENLLVEFPGWIIHEVTPLQSAPDSPPRVSLVLEQYRLTAPMKDEVPAWYLETSRPFDEFLKEADCEVEEEIDGEASPD